MIYNLKHLEVKHSLNILIEFTFPPFPADRRNNTHQLDRCKILIQQVQPMLYNILDKCSYCTAIKSLVIIFKLKSLPHIKPLKLFR